MTDEGVGAGEGPEDRRSPPLGVVHFVTGGGTGSTRVALDLALAQVSDPDFAPHIIFRSKGKPLPPGMVREMEVAGLTFDLIPNLLPRGRVIRALADRLSRLSPGLFFAHGYSEHLWGRRAALRAGVPLIVHVEHSEERYLPWRLLSARRLSRLTAATICVSNGVRASVLRLGIGGNRVEVIHNGIATERFRCDTPIVERPPNIVMAARFSRKKDQATLIRAARILVDRGWKGRLILAGGGKRIHLRRCRDLARELGIEARVDFPGQVDDLPGLYSQARVAALSSHREGFGLVLVEAMAAGCAVVASRIPGIVDVVRDGETGRLFQAGNAESAADFLEEALTGDETVQKRIAGGRQAADESFSVAAMARRYRSMIDSLPRGR